MSTKPYLYIRCRKKIKFIKGLIKHLNTCKSHIYLTTIQKISQKYHNKIDVTNKNFEEEGDLLGKTDNTSIVYSSTLDTLTENIPQKGLFASKSLSMLEEKQFSIYKFSTGIPVLDMKYRYLGSKHKSNLYPFNYQFDALAYYFTKLEIAKGNINKFLTDPLMVFLTEKLSYKNTNEWIEKLSKILWGILKDK